MSPWRVRSGHPQLSPGPLTRLAAWYVTGPVGHLVAFVLDIGQLLGRMLWLRARGRRMRWR